MSPRPRELRSEGRSDNCCQRGLAQGPGAAAQSSWRCRGAELDLAAPRSAALELRPAPSCGAERSRGRAKVQRRQRGLCGRDFFSRVERRNRAALLPPACPPRGLFNSVGFQVVRAGTQKPCPVPFRMHFPSLGGSPVGAGAPCVLLERGAVGLPAVGLPRGFSPRIWVPLESPTSSARTGSCGGVPRPGSFGKFHPESWASHLGVGHPLKPTQPLKRAL